jgi:isocitrate/isopropylmalate dehydrogenase
MIAVLPGDGVGPEVTGEAIKVLNATGLDLEFVECTVGGKAYLVEGTPLPQEAKDACEEADAVLFGAVGHDYAPYGIPRKVLSYLRMEKGAYANVRPLKLYPGVKGSNRCGIADVDVVIIRDNAEGMALEHEGYMWKDGGVDKRVITSFGSKKIIHYAMEYALHEDRQRVSCVDQSNWLYSDKIFRNIFNEVSQEYKQLKTDRVNVDVAAMMQVQNPRSFDVIVAPDLFGDIFSGVVVGQIGSVGLAPSACIGEDFAFFEPIHGTAWDIAGEGVVNPIASILSGKLMLEWLDRRKEALKIEAAVTRVLYEGSVKPKDLGGDSGTSKVGDAVAEYVIDDSTPQFWEELTSDASLV